MVKYEIKLQSRDDKIVTNPIKVSSRHEARQVLELAVKLPEMAGGQGWILEDGEVAYEWDALQKKVNEIMTYQIRKYHPDKSVGYIHLPKDASRDDAMAAAKDRAIDGCKTELIMVKDANDRVGTVVAEFQAGDPVPASSGVYSVTIDYHEGINRESQGLPQPFKFALPAPIKDVKTAMSFAESRANNDSKPVKVTLYSGEEALCVFRGTGKQIVAATQTSTVTTNGSTSSGSIVKYVGREDNLKGSGTGYPETNGQTTRPGDKMPFYMLFQHVLSRGITHMISSSFNKKELEQTLKSIAKVEGTQVWIQTTQVVVPQGPKPIKYATPKTGPRVVQRLEVQAKQG